MWVSVRQWGQRLARRRASLEQRIAQLQAEPPIAGETAEAQVARAERARDLRLAQAALGALGEAEARQQRAAAAGRVAVLSTHR